MFNKKAESENWTADTFAFYIVFVIIAGACMIAFIYLLNSASSGPLKTQTGVEKNVLIDRIFSSPFCPIATDATLGITSPFVIDKEKFTSGTLITCYSGAAANERAFQFLLVGTPHLVAATPNWDTTLGVVSRETAQKAIFMKDNAIISAELSIEVQRDKQ
jgi:hypothetical protein